METIKSRRNQNSIGRRSTIAAQRCWKFFTKFFPRGFRDPKYIAWERDYKWRAHQQWQESLNASSFKALLKENRYIEIASTAVRIESRTNLLFSFEKMALRDAVRSNNGAKIFAEGLFELLHGKGQMETKFENWCDAVAHLPRKQTRVFTHPVVTVFPFIANPDSHIFLKPNVTKDAARKYDFDFRYTSTPGWEIYAQLLKFAALVREALKIKGPRDMIDIQSFIWVIGSDEYQNMAS